MGNLAIERTNPDYPALVVLNEVLGAGSASRLFLNLREEKGYTYGVYSNVIARKYAGPWTAGGDLRTRSDRRSDDGISARTEPHSRREGAGRGTRRGPRARSSRASRFRSNRRSN